MYENKTNLDYFSPKELVLLIINFGIKSCCEAEETFLEKEKEWIDFNLDEEFDYILGNKISIKLKRKI